MTVNTTPETDTTTALRWCKVRKGDLKRIDRLSPRMIVRLRADGATVTVMT